MNKFAWQICQEGYSKADALKNESIFTTANGSLGFRGDLDESKPGTELSSPGTYLNGFYEKEVIQYGERAHGFAEHGQTMINICNPKRLELAVNGESFCYSTSDIEQFERKLDMQNALSGHSMTWRTASGARLQIEAKRMVSMTRSDTALMEYTITAPDTDAELVLTAMLDTSVGNRTVGDDPRVGSGLREKPVTTDATLSELRGTLAVLAVKQSTRKSKLSYCCALGAELSREAKISLAVTDSAVSASFALTLGCGEAVTLRRTVAVAWGEQVDLSDTVAALQASSALPVEQLYAEQADYMSDFWSHASVTVTGNDQLTQGLRFNLFHLLQSTGKDGKTSIAAKGLTGEGYEGHFFWESEAYIAPVFMFTQPKVAKAMLQYRYSKLANARRHAQLLGHSNGILYPWRSIGGDECSAYFPAGSAQYHINGDICYAIRRYLTTTGDLDFVAQHAAEIVIESARLWIDMGHYNSGEFCLDCVTGPDEYTAIVNNNCYTNLMAQDNLRLACELYELLKEQRPQQLAELQKRIGLDEKELVAFADAAQRMRLPYSEEKGIFMQDDSFLDKKELDFSSLKRPLLLHYHPLFIYRHQVCKQADWILAVSYMKNKFSPEQKRRDFDYYNKVTTHDSSLSACIFSIVAADIGYNELAHSLFLKTVRTDLDDIHNNTKDGLHMANMAGAWGCLMFGFAGASLEDNRLTFDPHAIHGEQGYSISFTYMGSVLELSVQGDNAVYRLKNDCPCELYHRNEKISLNSDSREQTKPITSQKEN